MEYRVTWAIDVTADSPEDAARQARDAQLCEDTTAVVFDVERVSDVAVYPTVRVDLLYLDTSPSVWCVNRTIIPPHRISTF